MQNDAVSAPPPPASVGPTKRTRRPSVRLHQPYFENPNHLRLQRQWKPIKKRSDAVKKPRIVSKNMVNSNEEKSGGVDSDDGGGSRDGDDDVAIGNWKGFNDRDFKRKRVRPSTSEKLVDEIDHPPLSNEDEDEEDQGDGDGDGDDSNLVVENSDPSSPNRSSGDDDDNDDDDDDDDNGEERIEVIELKKSRDSNGGYGVRGWLNRLGLDKYAPLFEIHEVDEEVLAHLTLEDLKDMGINAVGSRRKMYASIQKLGKGLS